MNTYSKAKSTSLQAHGASVVPCAVCGKTVAIESGDEIILSRKHGGERHETPIKIRRWGNAKG